MADSHIERLKRAYISLDGLSVGDAFGAFYEFNFAKASRIQSRTLFKPPWRYTDDTNMSLSIVAILRRYQAINQDELALHFAKYYDRSRGYGMATRSLMAKIRDGAQWKEAASNVFKGQGSYGNGGPMRAAPIGAYFADDIELSIENARLATEITHRHPEAVAGAIAVATGTACAWKLRGSGEINSKALLDNVIEYVPASEVRNRLLAARDLPADTTVQKAVKTLGNGANVSTQDTVPFALWCAAHHLDNYDEALWLTVSGLGDADTTCAIVGGIVALYTGIEGIPAEWLASRETLPNWAFDDNL